MDLTFSQTQLRWKDAAATFVRDCSPPSATREEAWLRRAYITCREAGVFDCASQCGPDLLTLCLVAAELARLDAGLAVTLINRSLCYRALLQAGREWDELTTSIRDSRSPTSAVAILSGTARRADRIEFDESASLVQQDTTLCLGWTFDAHREATGFVITGASLAQLVEPTEFEGFGSLRLTRLKGALTGKMGRLRSLPDSPQHLATARAERILLFTSLAISLAKSALNYALDYSRGRVSFDRPLCQHQAVALRLADMAIRIESANLLLWEVSMRAGGPVPDEALQCAEFCGRIAAEAGSWASQVLGGHGFLLDHPLALWLREIHLARLLAGDAISAGEGGR